MNTILKIDFDIDYKYWSFPTIALNFHSKELEIEILCFGIYFSIGK